MNEKLKTFQRFLREHKNDLFNKVIHNYYFIYISQEFTEDERMNINKKLKESCTIVIDHHKNDELYFIIGFQQTIIIIKSSAFPIFQKLFLDNTQIKICFLQETKEIFNQNNIKFDQANNDEYFTEEVNNMNNNLFNKQNEILIIIRSCISTYLIKNCYNDLNYDRFKYFYSPSTKNQNIKLIKKDDYIELKQIGFGTLFKTDLIYHIKDNKIYLVKKQNGFDNEIQKLIKRETENYEEMIYPLFPRLIGRIFDKEEKRYELVIEYIYGLDLYETKIVQFSDVEIFSIIFHLLSIFQYLHTNGFIYRDLKPNNVIIDNNKTLVLIDFDRMIKEKKKESNSEKNEPQTANFSTDFVDPDIFNGHATLKSDIYSIGKIIKYILNEISQRKNKIIYYDEFQRIINLCTKENRDDRPTINDLISELISLSFKYNITLKHIDPKMQTVIGSILLKQGDIYGAVEYFTFAANQNFPEAQHNLGFYYTQNYSFDINKAIHYYTLAADNNIPMSQFNLGQIYLNGIYVKRDINKAIKYFTLAANQNDIEALLYLGNIYYEGKYVMRNISNAIHYFEQAANQNDPRSQLIIANIYYDGIYVTRDINKVLKYLKQAADQNLTEAQFNIGEIYYQGKFIQRDINKAIQYFTYAANQKYATAQLHLGEIYYQGEFIQRDINKAIQYFLQAANQNNVTAQLRLGEIYYRGEFIQRDINKAIQYFTYAANQNNLTAQCNLGEIFYGGDFNIRDINKAIRYLTYAANQNYVTAQLRLFEIYIEGKYITQNIKLAIHYLKQAANQKNPLAQFNMGLIYYENKFVLRDINQAIHYFSLAAKQNNPNAAFLLGLIYNEGYYVSRDIDRAIYYYTLAANLNYYDAYHNLGIIYENGIYKKRDVDKAIHYFTLASNGNVSQSKRMLAYIYMYDLHNKEKAIIYFKLAANQNDSIAQFELAKFYFNENKMNDAYHYLLLAANGNHSKSQYLIGLYYFAGFHLRQNINRGIYWIKRASDNNFIMAHFVLGFLYQEGKYENLDIEKSIHFYKEASSFNDQYAKNNLGIIYKHGFEDKIKRNTSNAEIYFIEAINQKYDKVAMYNLSHIYIFDYHTDEFIIKSIDLLIKSSMLHFEPSIYLLYLILVMKYGSDIELIKNELLKLSYDQNKVNKILNFNLHELQILCLFPPKKIKEIYQSFKDTDFLYDECTIPIKSIKVFPQKIVNKESTINDKYNINEDFYKGFQ